MKIDGIKSGAEAEAEFEAQKAAGKAPEVQSFKLEVTPDNEVDFDKMRAAAEKFGKDMGNSIPKEIEASDAERELMGVMASTGFTAGAMYMKRTIENAAKDGVARSLAALAAHALLGANCDCPNCKKRKGQEEGESGTRH